MSEYDDLYQRKRKTSWYDRLSDPARDWLDGLVEHAAVHGEPIWAHAWRVMSDRFPDDAPDTDTTIKTTVRKLIRSRG